MNLKRENCYFDCISNSLSPQMSQKTKQKIRNSPFLIFFDLSAQNFDLLFFAPKIVDWNFLRSEFAIYCPLLNKITPPPRLMHGWTILSEGTKLLKTAETALDQKFCNVLQNVAWNFAGFNFRCMYWIVLRKLQ